MTNASNELLESWLSSTSKISEELKYLEKSIKSNESEKGGNENNNSVVLLGLQYAVITQVNMLK